MIEKIILIDQIEVTELGHIQVRQATKIVEDGKELSRVFHRHVLSPNDSLEGQDPKVIAIANAIWTPEVIATYQASIVNKIT